MDSAATNARKTFELENNVEVLESDKIYQYNEDDHRKIVEQRPWKNDPQYFRRVRISAVALIKMVMHARSGGIYEIMGLMQGKIDGDTFVVMDAFALPVQGTETRVNAADEANEYVVQYLEKAKSIGRKENIVGWYHSHPGYGCWLSGIDVTTQMTHQQFTDPFLAIVIDPNRTISAGKVDIGAFRTYPQDYTPPDSDTSTNQSVPLDKVEDFGVHAARYYPLQVSHFKSSLDTHLLDLLWNKYWAMTLSQSPLISNRAYISSRLSDLADKLGRADSSVKQRTPITTLAPTSLFTPPSNSSSSKDKQKRGSSTSSPKKDDSALHRVVEESDAISSECAHGLIAQVLKNAIFNTQNGSVEVEFPTII